MQQQPQNQFIWRAATEEAYMLLHWRPDGIQELLILPLRGGVADTLSLNLHLNVCVSGSPTVHRHADWG